MNNHHFSEEKGNGDVRFDVADLETGNTNSTNQKRASTVKVIRRRQSGYGISITRWVLFPKFKPKKGGEIMYFFEQKKREEKKVNFAFFFCFLWDWIWIFFQDYKLTFYPLEVIIQDDFMKNLNSFPFSWFNKM